MAVISPNPRVDNLNLTFHESTLVCPSPSPFTNNNPKSLFLSNIDQILNYSIPTVFFFQSNPLYPPQLVTQRLKKALQTLLLTYDFMAGRLHFNHLQGRLEILCNDAGVGFITASSQSTIADLGDLLSPNPQFQQLATQYLKDQQPQPLFILQVTSFKCGGFAIGMSVNHISLDGISAKEFKLNLASLAFDDGRPLAVNPYLDRRLLTARSPPHVEFPHPEFFKPQLPTNVPPVFDCDRSEELEFRVFSLTPADVKFLKDKVAASSAADAKISSFSVVVALIWRCKALSLSSDSESARSRVSALLNVVDIRSRIKPGLPDGYCGNAVLVAQTAAECGELLKDDEFGKIAEKVGNGPRGMGDEYVRSAIDWLEVNKGLPNGEYMVSSWLRLGFHEVEWPWGYPHHCGPLPNHRKDICWVFPTDGGLINALVALPPPQMDRFIAHFRHFFPQPPNSN